MLRFRGLRPFLVFTFVLAMATTGFGWPGNGGGGHGGGGQEPPPPVLLQPHIFYAPHDQDGAGFYDVNDCNNDLQAVGSYGCDFDGDGTFEVRGYLYDPLVDADNAIDLNDIVAGIPEGWAIRKAWGINAHGDIAAYIEPIATPFDPLQAVFIDMSDDMTSGVLYVIPDSEISVWSIALDVNDLGDVVARYDRPNGTRGVYVHNFGLYDPMLATPGPIDVGACDATQTAMINNYGEVVYHESDGTIVRTTPGGAIDTFSGLSVARSINDRGEFCGSAPVFVRKNKSVDRPYIAGTQVEVYDIDGWNQARDLNETADFIDFGHIYHQDLGSFDPESLLDPNDPDTAVFESAQVAYSLWTMTDRDVVTGFPIVFGHKGQFGFALVPVPAP